MKIQTLLQTGLICILFTSFLSAQCSISDLIIEASACDSDGFVTIDIEFEVIDPGPDNMFTITGNGVDYGTFEYGETFYTIGPVDANCETIYEVVITDVNDNSCSESIAFGQPICCSGCNELIVDYVGTNECTGSGTFFMEILIDHPTSETFDVYIGSVDYGTFEYGEEIYTFGPFTGDCTTERYVSVQDLSIFCEADITVEPVCCPEFCSISDITVEALECTSDETFSIELNFNYAEVEEDNFDLWANGSIHGTYAYADLPIIIDDFPSNGNENPYVTVFGIGQDVLCADDLAFEGLDCSEEACIISDVEAEASCTDDGLFIDVWFNYENVGASNQFVIDVNGQEFGPFEYGESFYSVGPVEFPCDQSQFINVVDIDNTSCSGFFNLELSDGFCCEEEECVVDNLTVETSECDNGTDIEVNFELIGGSGDVYITLNEETYGPYSDPTLPITYISFLYDTEYITVTVCDAINEECCATVEVLNPCYEQNENCEMTVLDYSTPECIDGQIIAEWIIDGENISEVGYDIFINDEFEIFIEWSEDWSYEFEINDPGTEYFSIKVCDNDNEDCCIEWELENPCYEPDMMNCNISNLIAEAYDCNENGEIYFDIAFDVINPGDDNQFTVVGNGNDYGIFEYGEAFYTVGPFMADCETEVELIITDLNDNDCSAYVGFDEIFCCEDENECVMTTLDFGPNPECQDGLIITEWLIDGENISEVGFDIFINEEFETFVQWNNSSWYEFDIENPGTEIFTMKVCDNDNEGCCIEWELENPCYESDTEECTISEIEIDAACDGSSTYFELDFEYDNNAAATFQIQVNDDYTESYSYDELPITIFGLDYETDYITVTITDNEDPNCTAAIEFNNPCFEDGDLECGIFDLEVEVNDCNEDGNIYFDISFYVNNPGSDNQFTVAGNGNDYGTFEYGESVYTVGPFVPDCETIAELVITDINHDNCSAVWEGEETLCCEEDEPEECNISEVFVEALECNDENEVYFHLTFDYENIGDDNQFTVVGNGNNYGTFEYGLDYYEIGPIEADCETELEFIVTDVNYNDCSSFVEHEPVCCDDECPLIALSTEATECLENNTFNLTVDIEIDGESNDFFDLFINGDFVEFYEFDALPITIEELSYETEYLTIEVCENDNEDCCLISELMNPCFEESNQEFFINEIEYELVSCDNDIVMMSVDFVHGANDDQFEIKANGISYGTFEYASLPIMVDNIAADGSTDYTFSIEDTSIEDLINSFSVGTILCDGDVILDVQDNEFDPAKIISIKAFDITGKYLGDYSYEESQKIIDLDRSVSSGILILRIETTNKILTKKIVRLN